MAKGKSDPNTSILEYALRHLEQEREDIQSKIDHIRRQLGGWVSSGAASSAAPAAEPSAAAPGRKKRVLSAAARKRIALAQKRRWAEHRKAKGKAAAA
jgi:hypothetical protein